MPELPEVETMCRGIRGVVGARVDKVEFRLGRLKPLSVKPSRPQFRRRAQGRIIQRIDRIGKRIVIGFDSDLVQVIEPRMTGLLLIAQSPTEEHLRVGWHLSDCSVPSFWFWDRRGLGTLQLMTERELRQRLGPDRIGPDALSLAPGQIQQRLGHSRRPVKVALLDQKVVAGIGNLYASEILNVARVHPGKPCVGVTHSEWRRIDEAIADVLEEAIYFEGSTLADGTYRNALNRAGSYQNHHRVYARAGEPCTVCQAPIVRAVHAQRSTFWCPECQRL